MANFKIEIDPVCDVIIKTLNFMGKDYIEKWVENNTHCGCGIEALVMRDYPKLDEYEENIIQSITFMDEDELLEALSELTEYERKG